MSHIGRGPGPHTNLYKGCGYTTPGDESRLRLRKGGIITDIAEISAGLKNERIYIRERLIWCYHYAKKEKGKKTK